MGASRAGDSGGCNRASLATLANEGAAGKVEPGLAIRTSSERFARQHCFFATNAHVTIHARLSSLYHETVEEVAK